MSSRIHWSELLNQEEKVKTGILNLSDYQFTSVPSNIKDMTWLTELNLGKNEIIKIEGLENLVNLKTLDLNSNHITKIEGLNTLINLEWLELGNNSITKLEGLANLKNLRYLSLMSNSVSKIEELDDLESLMSLQLFKNQIDSLFPFIPLLKKGFYISLGREPIEDGKKVINLLVNPISDPPLEIIQSGNEAILKYFEEKNSIAVKKLDILKVIIVGNSQVGKSNFSQFLREGTINQDSESTHILDIQKWDADFLVSEQGVKTRLHLFDFGGQDYYHDAHRMYYSHDTAYILLWDTVSNEYQELQEQLNDINDGILYENFPLPYWLQSINYTLQGKYNDTPGKTDDKLNGSDFINNNKELAWLTERNAPPILIIQNKIDIENGKLNQEELSKQYPNIWGYFGVSLMMKKRTDVLKELLSDYLRELNLTGRVLLIYQYKIVQHFSENPEKELIIYSLSEFKDACIAIIDDTSVVFEDRDARIIAQILNNIGIVLYYEAEGKAPYIFSNIGLLNEQIKQIMDYAKHGHIKGVFQRQDVLDDIDIKNEEQILELLCGNKSIIELSETSYLAPQFLPTEPDKSIKFFLHTFNHLQMRFVYPAYYHKSILLNLFTTYLNEVKDFISVNSEAFPFWRNGIIVSKGQNEDKEMVFVEFVKNKQNAIINIKTMRPFCNKNLEGDIEKLMDELNKGWTVNKEVSADSEVFIEINKLQGKYRNKQFEFVSGNKRFRINDFKDLAYFENRPKRIFISYSSLDKEYLKQFTTQIVSLRNEGLVETWDDRELQAGDKWDIVIKEQLDKADYVILFITANFLNSEYIKEVELKNALQQQKGIIPIIIDYCTWNYDDTIKNIQVLNKEFPLTSYTPVSKGWVEVIKSLKLILEK